MIEVDGSHGAGDETDSTEDDDARGRKLLVGWLARCGSLNRCRVGCASRRGQTVRSTTSSGRGRASRTHCRKVRAHPAPGRRALFLTSSRNASFAGRNAIPSKSPNRLSSCLICFFLSVLTSSVGRCGSAVILRLARPHLLPHTTPPVEHQAQRGVRPKKQRQVIALVIRQQIGPRPSADTRGISQAGGKALRVDLEVDIVMEPRGRCRPSRLSFISHAPSN